MEPIQALMLHPKSKSKKFAVSAATGAATGTAASAKSHGGKIKTFSYLNNDYFTPPTNDASTSSDGSSSNSFSDALSKASQSLFG